MARPKMADRVGLARCEALGEGGFLTWQSSPHVMWWLWLLAGSPK